MPRSNYKIVPWKAEYKGKPIAYNVIDKDKNILATFDGSREMRIATHPGMKGIYEKILSHDEALKIC
jgi:hypothetical protein